MSRGADILITKSRVLGIAIALALVWSATIASIQSPRWSGWQLDIDNKRCELLNEFKVHPRNLQSNGGFLTGTPFESVKLRVVAHTNSRDVNPCQLGQAMLAIHIVSHEDLEPSDRIEVVNFGGAETTAVKWGKRPPGDTLHERYAAFWFMGADAETLITRLSQGEALPLSFVSRSGDRVVETEFTPKRRDRFPAWEAAFRACALANLE